MTEPRPADAPAPGLHPIGSDPVDPAAAERAAATLSVDPTEVHDARK